MSFESVLLEDLAAPQKNAIVGGPFGSNLVSKDYVDQGTPVIRGQNMGGRWVSGDFAYVSAMKADALSPNKARPGDLIFTQRGTLGQVSIVPSGPYDEYIVSQSQMKATLDPERADVHFLYYVFRSPEQLEYIQNTAIQTGVPHTNLGILKKTPLKLPSIHTQRQIATILGALDDRIDLLRETNATLEAIAQALFKSWFVDFDPVRAKMAGRAPEGMDEATASLFPDALEETELGLVPKGWQQCFVDDVASLKGGKQLEKEYFKVDGLYPVFGGAGVMGRSDLFNADGFVITVGRVGAYCGQYFWTQGKAWVNNNASLVSAKTAAHSVWLLHWLKSVDMDAIKKGAAQPFVSNGDIAALKMALPPNNLIGQFVEVCAPIFLRLSELSSQAQTLTDLRDSLLPRLISGQLSLPEVQDGIRTVNL